MNRGATVLILALLLGAGFSVISPQVAGAPAEPPRGVEVVAKSLMEIEEAPLAGVSVLGDYAFVGGQSIGYWSTESQGIRVVDLSTPEQPQLVSRIPLRNRDWWGFNHSHGDAVAARITSPFFDGDIAVVLNGVPDTFAPEDYPQPHGIWNVTDPSNPQFLSILDIGWQPWGSDQGDLSDKPYDNKAIAGTHLYTIYDADMDPFSYYVPRDAHVAVVDLSDPSNPAVVGDWQDDPEVMLMGLTLNEAGTRAYVTGKWPGMVTSPDRDGYIYILDIENPSQPTEVARYIFPLRGVPPKAGWPTNSVFKAVPNDDESLLILADGSWKPGKCGILTILDMSDPSAIHEISTFSLPESISSLSGPEGPYLCKAIATDLVVEGNLIYSTWGDGGLRVVDISDPRRPVQVGEFRVPEGDGHHPPHPEGRWLSDVAVKDDLIIATRSWDAGLYIFRLTDEVPTVVIDETRSPRVSTNTIAIPGYHVSWEWPDGTRESAWDGFLNIGFQNFCCTDYEIGDDGWVDVEVQQFQVGGFQSAASKIDLEVTGVYSWGVKDYVMETEPAGVIFDRVQVFLSAPERLNLGDRVSWSAFYEYDGTPFLGDITVLGESNLVGKFTHTVQAISDPLYGIETFRSNVVTVIYDRVEVTLEVGTPTIPVGEAAQIQVEARYAYDGTPFQGSVVLSNELIQSEAGTYSYTVLLIEDTAYGLTAFSSNTVSLTFIAAPAQNPSLMMLFGLVAAVGVGVVLWRKPWRPRGAKTRVDDAEW